MILDRTERALFFKLIFGLMSFVNERKRLVLGAKERPTDFESLSLEEKRLIHDALGADRAVLIDVYVAENPDALDGEELEEVRSWKGAVRGKFFAFKQLKAHMVMIHADGSEKVYAVHGLSQPITSGPFPILVETTLLPFRGKIVYEVILVAMNVSFGAGIKSSLNEIYRSVKTDGGIVVSLADISMPRVKKRKPTAKEKVDALAVELRGKLGRIRELKREIDEFQGVVVPKFDAWVKKNLKKEKAVLEKLLDDVEMLTHAIARMEWQWRTNRQRKVTKSGVADAVLAEMEVARQEYDETAEEEEETPTAESDGGMEDLMLDFLFAEYMREMRGIDIAQMGDAELEKARAKFLESVDHAKAGDKSAFEKGMYRIGADESSENTTAVKKAFRSLARKLHPDVNKDFGDEAKELWEQLLTAKQALDLEGIEKIALHWRIIQNENISAKDVKPMKEFGEELLDEMEELEYAREDLRDHPVWPYREEKISKKTSGKIRERMENDIILLTREKQMLEEKIAEFRKEPARKKAVKPTKKVAKKVWMRMPEKKKPNDGGSAQDQFGF